MERFWHLSRWVSRAVLLFGAFDYGFNASVYLFEPVLMAWNQGIGMWASTAATTTRVQFGCVPFALTLAALYCLAAPRRFLAGIALLFVVSLAQLAGYLAGLSLDGAVPRGLLLAERGMVATAIYGLGLAVERMRRSTGAMASA